MATRELSLSKSASKHITLEQYGAVADARTLVDGVISSGTAVLTSASAAFAAADVGKTIVVVGAGAAGIPLKTTILSVDSGTQVTLSANAATSVASAGEFVYGTNNLTTIQSAINAAVAAEKPLLISSAVEGFLFDGGLTVSGNLDIEGCGVKEIFGGALGGSFNALNFPTVAPYFKGSVLICAALSTNALTYTGTMPIANLRDFGIRFAGRWNLTGHGIYFLPPITSTVYRDNGLMSSEWHSVKVFGHDGDHYGAYIYNPLYNTLINFRAYGGGGIKLAQASNLCSCGNTVLIHPYVVVMTAGAAHGIWVTNEQNPFASNVINYIMAIRPQVWLLAPLPTITGVSPPTSAQKPIVMSTDFSVGRLDKCILIGADTETSVSSQNAFKMYAAGNVIGGGSWLGTLPGNTAQEAPTTGVTYQNTDGVSVMVSAQYTLTPIQATLSSALSTGGGAITSLPVDALTTAIPSGSTIKTISGGKTQSWVTTSVANVAATTVAVSSQTPNFNYPAASIVGMDASIVIQQSKNSNMSSPRTAAQALVPAGAVGSWRVTISYMWLIGQYIQTTEINSVRTGNADRQGVVSAY